MHRSPQTFLAEQVDDMYNAGAHGQTMGEMVDATSRFDNMEASSLSGTSPYHPPEDVPFELIVPTLAKETQT